MSRGVSLRRGFTMIEALVVVAIIGSLAAICIPVIQLVRAESLATRCSSVQRQIFSSNQVYCDDWHGAMVATFAAGGSAWISSLAQMADMDGNGQLWDLLRTGCPDWKNSGWFNHPWKNAWWKGYCRNPYLRLNKRNTSESSALHDLMGGDGYGFTNVVGNPIWAPNVPTLGRWVRMSEITYPTERIWLGDGIDYYYNWSLGTAPGNHGDQYRHRGRGAYTFADGHMERRGTVQGLTTGITLNR